MKRRRGLQQETAAKRIAPSKSEPRRSVVPYRYRDLDLGYQSDHVPDTTTDIYYKGVHVASLDVTGGGWCRADREQAPEPLPRVLGYHWLNFEDRYYVHTACLAKELSLVQGERFQKILRRQATELPPLRYYHQTLESVLGRPDDTWLYEKLSLLGRVSRKQIELQAHKLFAELRKDEDASERDEGLGSTLAVCSQREYLRKRVLRIAQILYNQMQLEIAAMKDSSTHSVIRACAYYMLSCSKTEGSSSSRSVAQKQLELITAWSEKFATSALNVLDSHLRLYLAIMTDNIDVEDVAFASSSAGDPVSLLIYPPSAEIYRKTSVDSFIESVIYKRLMRASNLRPDDAEVITCIRSLFVILVRNGDMTILVAALCTIIPRLLGRGNEHIIEYHSEILKRNKVGALLTQCKHVSAALINLYYQNDLHWLGKVCRSLRPVAPDKLVGLVLDGWVPLTDLLSIYDQIITAAGLESSQLSICNIYEWLTQSEAESIIDNWDGTRALNRRLSVEMDNGVVMKRAPETIFEKYWLLQALGIHITLSDFDVDWSDCLAVLEYIYISMRLKVERLIISSECDLKSMIADLIADLQTNTADVHPVDIWLILALLRYLNVSSRKLGIIPVDILILQKMAHIMTVVVQDIEIASPWYHWCRFVNRTVAFYYRYTQIYDDPQTYTLMYTIFEQVVKVLPSVGRLADILDGSLDARISARDITPLANLWTCALSTDMLLHFWLPLDNLLCSFAIRSQNNYALVRFASVLPYFDKSSLGL